MPNGLDEMTHRRLLAEALREKAISKRQADVYSLHTWGDDKKPTYTLYNLAKRLNVSLSTMERDQRQAKDVMQQAIRLYHWAESQKPLAPSEFVNTDEERIRFEIHVHSGANVWTVENTTERQVLQPRRGELPKVKRREVGEAA